jgi:dephospho-CoA kinase
MPKLSTTISSKLPIIGLTGTFAGGKDTLAKYLRDEFGYNHASTSDIVRKFAKEKYGSIERPILNKTATELRHTRGAGILAELALEEKKPLIVSGIRSLGEAKVVKAAGGIIVFVDASLEIRYARMQARQRDSEAKVTLEDFKARE